MTNLKQYETAKYLYDFANLNFLILNNPNQSIKNLFNNYIKNENIEDEQTYFKTMINVYVMFLKMKSFCILEEYNLKNKNNFVNNENLNLAPIRSKIIKTGGLNLSDKQLLKDIRNAFCHSDNENSLYSISRNGRFIGFDLENLNLKMNLNDVIDLSNAIASSTQTIQFTGYNYKKHISIKSFLKKLKFNRYYFTKKINVEDMDFMFELDKENKHNEFLNYAESLEDCHKKNIKLTNNQINNIVEEIKLLVKNKIITKDEIKKKKKDIVNILITKQLPLPISKLSQYQMDSFLAHYLYKVDGFSYEDIYKILTILIHNKETMEFSFEKYYEKEFNNDYDKLNFKLSLSHFDEKVIYPYMLFIEYVIVNFCCDEDIIIGENNIPYNKFRNSLIHARWVIEGDKIKFYDALPDIANETEYNFECELDFYELCDYCKDIMNNEIKKEKIYTKKA